MAAWLQAAILLLIANELSQQVAICILCKDEMGWDTTATARETVDESKTVLYPMLSPAIIRHLVMSLLIYSVAENAPTTRWYLMQRT